MENVLFVNMDIMKSSFSVSVKLCLLDVSLQMELEIVLHVNQVSSSMIKEIVKVYHHIVLKLMEIINVLNVSMDSLLTHPNNANPYHHSVRQLMPLEIVPSVKMVTLLVIMEIVKLSLQTVKSTVLQILNVLTANMDSMPPRMEIVFLYHPIV